MFRLYKELHAVSNTAAFVATQRQYTDILNAEYNIAFFQPKKDQCSKCAQYLLSEKSDEQNEVHEAHIKNKD